MGQNVTVLDEEQIKKIPASSLDELLRGVMGIEMQMRGVGGAQGDITVRGGTFNQVLVLLDGIRINDPLTGHFSSYIPIPVSSVRRIEIIRGPSSAQYGSEAVGAVINVVTFVPEKDNNGVYANLSGMLGENQWQSWDGTVMLTGSSWQVQLGGQHISTEGHEIDTSGSRADVMSNQYTIAGEWRPNDKWRTGVRGSWDDREFGAKYYYTRSPFDESREWVNRQFTQGFLEFSPNDFQRVYLRMGYQTTTDSFLFNPLFAGNFHETTHLDIQSGFQWDMSSEFSWQLGVQSLSSSIESSDRGDHAHQRFGVFGLSHWRPVSGVGLHGGLRLERDDNFGWAVNPQLGVHWEMASWAALRLYGGRAIRAADFTERYISNNLPGPLSDGRNVGNPNLIAERSWSVEMGADVRWPKKVVHRLSLFHRWGHDLIDYVLTEGSEIQSPMNLAPESMYFYSQNIASLNTSGLEYFVDFKHDFSERSWVSLLTGVTLIGIEGDTDQPSKYLAASSRVMWQNQLSLQWKRSNFTLQHMYRLRDEESAEAIGANLDADYHLWNARFSLRPYGFIPLTILIQVDNVADVAYSDILGAQMPGRWVKGGLRWQLGQRKSR